MASKSFEALWKHFVPRDGPPRTVHGEALRAIARISHEVNINGCANWSSELDASIATLQEQLGKPGQVSPDLLDGLVKDLHAIQVAGKLRREPSPDVSAAIS